MKFSNEMINAYADGELQGSEKKDFEAALLVDGELQQALDVVLSVKLRMGSAYRDIEAPAGNRINKIHYGAMVYALILLLGFTGGWYGSAIVETEVLEKHSAENAQAIEEQSGKYILHIGTHDSEKFRSILDKAESLVAHYQDDMQIIELEIIANAGGLDLFRKDVSPYAQRVTQLSQKYPNIRFIACANAIERLKEKGITPDIIETVHQGPTAIDQVVKRMNQGWNYIKI